MEVQVKELLESIQKDGIEAAEKKSEELIGSAKKKSEKIIADAKKEAAAIIKDAEERAKRIEASSRASLGQASRDLLLSLEKKIISVFDSMLFSEVEKSVKGDTLTDLIKTVVSSEIIPASDARIELSKKDAKAIKAELTKGLDKQIKKGLEIKPVEGVQSGFLLTQKDGKGYYDFSTKEIAELISRFVNPYLSEIIKEAAQKGD